MAYIRPCNKCSQRISMREMRAGQWVAFDASTDKPHKCGKKNKEDPNIKELAKQKNKDQEPDNIDLGYELEIDKDIEVLEKRLENIKREQEEKRKIEKEERLRNIKIEQEKIIQKQNHNVESVPEQKEIISKPNYPIYEKKSKGWEFYFWIVVVAINLLALARCTSG
tara:strand:- start:3975 stop:4475 length:501 start_codon:yes stop_codon:yes gene_type:complete